MRKLKKMTSYPKSYHWEKFAVVKYALILMNIVIISDSYSQVLFFDNNTSGSTIAFSFVKSHDVNGQGVDCAYVFSGKHALAFGYGSVEDTDHKWNYKSYGFSYIGIMHETTTNPKMPIQGALNLDYIHIPNLGRDAINIGLSLFKRFKFKQIILLPEIYGGYGVTGGGSPAQYLRQGGISISLGLKFGPRKEHLIALGPAIAWSEDTWAVSFGIGLAMNSILH
jgi:hypothetical protein